MVLNMPEILERKRWEDCASEIHRQQSNRRIIPRLPRLDSEQTLNLHHQIFPVRFLSRFRV